MAANTNETIPAPPPKNKNKTNSERIERATKRIQIAAGCELSELFGEHAPPTWGQSLLEQLATTIELAKKGKAGITVEQLAARLNEEATRDPAAKGVITNSIATRIRLEIGGNSQGCAPPGGEDADSDGDTHMTSSPSKDRPCKRRRKNSETEHEPQAVRTEDAEDEEDADDSRGIVSPSAEAKGPVSTPTTSPL